MFHVLEEPLLSYKCLKEHTEQESPRSKPPCLALTLKDHPSKNRVSHEHVALQPEQATAWRVVRVISPVSIPSGFGKQSFPFLS